jgi:carboxylesterase type B
VTAWGESAGGGSVMHHITQYGGKRDPLFKRAIIQSPGFSIATFDRRGQNEQLYKDFLRYAGCKDKDISCLREKETKTLVEAQDKVIGDAPEGTFAFGPSADGEFVRQFAQLELASGNYYKDLESVIITHVTDEGSLFVPKDGLYNDDNFASYLDWQYGNKSAVTKALLNKFKLSSYPDARARLVDYTKLSSFTCSTRMVARAYADKFYTAQVSGIHGTDILSDFFDAQSSVAKIAALFKVTSTEGIYQKYLTNYMGNGNPSMWWPKGVYGREIKNVLDVGKKLAITTDKHNNEEDCEPIIGALAAATALDGKQLVVLNIHLIIFTGYSPSDGVVKNQIVDVLQMGTKASRHFKLQGL